MPSSTEPGHRHGPTAAEMIKAGGFLNFVRAVRFAARYGEACRQASPKGGPRVLLTITEYAKATGITRDHGYREQRAWRACCGNVNVFDVLPDEVLTKHNYAGDAREAVIARALMEGGS